MNVMVWFFEHYQTFSRLMTGEDDVHGQTLLQRVVKDDDESLDSLGAFELGEEDSIFLAKDAERTEFVPDVSN